MNATTDNALRPLPDHKLPRPNNMGLLRYYLSLSVFINHFNVLTGHDFQWPTSSSDRLGAFFVMSGFLIYGSYARRGDTRSFMLRRVKRLVPAYSFFIVLFAIALVAMSTLPAAEYFGSWHWWRYLLSNLLFLNFLEPTLPGVFTTLEQPAVNGAMWTLKVEWMMYFTVPLVVWLYNRLRRPSPLLFFGTVYLLSVAYSAFLLHQYEVTGRAIYETLQRQCFGQMAYFYFGVLLYFLFTRVMALRWIVLPLALATYVLTFGGGTAAVMLRPLAIGALVVTLSFMGTGPRWNRLTRWADTSNNISYDIYLCHYPVIQLLLALGVIDALGPYMGFGLCAVITVALAAFSWFVIGRPVLEHRGWWAALSRRLRPAAA